MVATDVVSEREYRRIALEDPDGRWELWDGKLVEKPVMSVERESFANELAFVLRRQLPWDAYRVRTGGPRLRRSAQRYFLPDVSVIPAALESALRQNPGALDAYPEPLPLVVEIWSPSTGTYDVGEKLEGYRVRGDGEIWYVHPYQRALTIWRRQADGSYVTSTHDGGIIEPRTLPGVLVDLDDLFARCT